MTRTDPSFTWPPSPPQGRCPHHLRAKPAPERIKRGATISPDGVYRYGLQRLWSPGHGILRWVMLNPSTADGITDDNTVRKCIGFAWRLGFGGIQVVNLYAYRATDPRQLGAIEGDPHRADLSAPAGPENDRVLHNVATQAAATTSPGGGMAATSALRGVIAAWGGRPTGMPQRAWYSRTMAVATIFEVQGVPLWCFGTTQAGQPRHPRTLAYATPLTLWSPP